MESLLLNSIECPAAGELLSLALRSRFDPGSRNRLAHWFESADAVDWTRVHEIIQGQRLAPLVHHILRAHALPDLPRRLFRASYQSNQLRTLIILNELRGLLQALAAAEIECVVLKGAALAETVYPNPVVRPLGDVDMLVHRRDLQKLRRAVADLGFHPLRLEQQSGVHEDFENEVVFRKPGPLPVDIDVHWSLFDSPYYQNSISMQWFWDTSRPAQIGDTAARVLGVEAEIIHLCGHLCLHHSGTELFWLHDIAEVAASYHGRIDWPLLIDRVRRFELVLPVRDTLSRVAADWGAPIPAAVLADLQALEPSTHEKRVHGWLTAAHRPAGQRLWADLASLPSWTQRLRFLWANLVPSADYMRQRYNIRSPLLLPLYYPYRWYRGIRGTE